MEGVFEKFNLPVGGCLEKGAAEISTYEFSNKKDPLFNLRAIRDSGMGYMEEGKYVRLIVNGQLVMSDTRMEKNSNREFCREAHGKVLIAGLGLGLILHNLIWSGIDHVTVIEKEQDVIDLVSPYLESFKKKLTIIQADIFEWIPKKEEKWNVIYFDIWPDVSIDNLEEIRKLHNRFKFKLDRTDSNCWMDSWMKDHLQAEKRRERLSYW